MGVRSDVGIAMKEYVFQNLSEKAKKFLEEWEFEEREVCTPEQVKDDPQVQARKTVRKYHHKIIGDFLGPKPLASMFGEAITLGDAPLQGEHTIEILSELGYAENVQKDLLEKSVIKKSGT